MSSALYRDLFQIDEAIRRNEEAAELGAAAGFANAVLQSGIDQLFTDLTRGEVGRAEARWPELWDRTQQTKRTSGSWPGAGRKSGDRPQERGPCRSALLAQEAIDQSREVQRAKYELAARLVLRGPHGTRPTRAWDRRAARRSTASGDSVTRRRCGEHGGPWERRSLRRARMTKARRRGGGRQTFAAHLRRHLAPEAGPLLAAEPSREILSAAGSS